MKSRSRLLLCSCVLLASGLGATAGADPALVTASGLVEIGQGQPPVWRAARSGEALALGDAVRTGPGGRAELALGDGRVVRVYEQSVLRLGTDMTPTGAARSVALDEGTSLFEVMKKAVSDEFEVRTPEIVVSVKGTRFLVGAVPGPDYTSVFRGAVSLAGSGFDEVSVRAGFSGAAGDVLMHSFGDPWNAWEAGRAAPAPAIEESRAGEVREAIQAAREDRAEREVADAPAKREQRVEDALEEGRGKHRDLDSVVDVARRNAREGNLSQANGTLLDTILGGEASDLPGNGGSHGNGPGGSHGNGPGDPGGPGGTTTPFPFTFDVTTSGGPNTVTLGFGNHSVTLDQNDVNTLLQGSASPLGGLNGVVNHLGVDRDALAQYLDSLI